MSDRDALPIDVDVVIIGASVTGAALAKELARGGASVIVLEKDDVAHAEGDALVVLSESHAPVPLAIDVAVAGSSRRIRVVDPVRLACAWLHEARFWGASFRSGVHVAKALLEEGRVAGIVAVDVATGETIEVRTREVICADPLHAESLLRDSEARHEFDIHEDAQLGFSIPMLEVAIELPTEHATLVPTGGNAWLVADETHTLDDAAARRAIASASSLLPSASLSLVGARTRRRITARGREAEPFVVLEHAPGFRSLIVNHFDQHREAARALAKELVELSEDEVTSPPPDTDRVAPWTLAALHRRYGANTDTLIEQLTDDVRTTHTVCACQNVVDAEVRFAIRFEGAHHLTHVTRRTGLGRGLCGGLRCAEEAARIVGEERELSLSERDDERRALLRLVHQKRLRVLDDGNCMRLELGAWIERELIAPTPDELA